MKSKITKNKFLKLASLVVTLCLITTCAISTTFAKYATQDTAADTARVAKWGVTASASGTLFGKDYKKTIVKSDDTGITVSAKEINDVRDKVVAPGTENNVGLKIKLTGTPEVAYKITGTADTQNNDIYLAAGNYGNMVVVYGVNDATDISNYYVKNDDENYEKNGATAYVAGTTYYELLNEVTVAEVYYPIEWKLSNSAAVLANLDAVEDAINTALGLTLTDGALTKVGTPNTTLDNEVTLTWSWAFENETDEEDTILGDLIAGEITVVVEGENGVYYPITVTAANATANGETVANLQVHFGYTVRVEQVD